MQKIITSILLLVIGFNSFAQETDEVIDQIIGIVGKNIIMQSDIENQYNQYMSQGVVYDGDLKCKIIEDLLFQKLLLNQAQLDSIEVSEAEINDNLDRRIRYFVSQIGSEEKLEEFYGKPIIEIKEEFKSVLKDQMLVEKMQGKITADIKVTPSEIRKFYNNIPKDSLPKIETKYIFKQLVIKPNISEKEKLAVKEKLREFKERVKNGTKFSTLAVMYSEDPGSAKNGGELGYVGRSDLVPEFAAVAFKLKSPGDVSKIVESQYGFHIIQLIDRKGDKINVRHILIKPKVSYEELAKAKQKLDSIRNLIVKDTISFENAVLKFSEDKDTKFNEGYVVNQYTGNNEFFEEQISPAIAYAIKNLNIGSITYPFKTKTISDEDIYSIIKFDNKIAAHSATIQDDYKQIQEMCIADKKQKTITEWVKNKVKSTYFRIDDSYSNCETLKGTWLK